MKFKTPNIVPDNFINAKIKIHKTKGSNKSLKWQKRK